MTVAKDKAMISGIVGALGAVAAVISGLPSMFMLAGFGTFFFTMLIQYGSIKVKLVVSLVGGLGLGSLYFVGGGSP